VIFGGYYYPQFGGFGQTGDAWALSLSGSPVWTQLPTGSPRSGAAAVYDPQHDQMVVYGGEYRPGLNEYALSDAWALVWGVPHPNPTISTIPIAMDFGGVEVGMNPARGLVISNIGAAPLDVSSISSDDPTLTVDPDAFALAPGETRSATVQWSPTAAGALDAHLAIASSDPSSPLRSVPVTGRADVVGVAAGPARWTGGITSIAPNPSAGQLEVRFDVSGGPVRLSIHDIQGREVAVLLDGLCSAGSHVAHWDARSGRAGCPAAVYYVRLHFRDQTVARRFALVR
jgi:hypothetical protein